jgi:hypothetical protein
MCSDLGSHFASLILRAIVETIKQLNTKETHSIRKTRGGNSPQITRGSDKAMSRNINRDIRLHYWVISQGHYELASVVYHNDFTNIPK